VVFTPSLKDQNYMDNYCVIMQRLGKAERAGVFVEQNKELRTYRKVSENQLKSKAVMLVVLDL
jgi:signal transduction protein with GAF and PtsI domain